MRAFTYAAEQPWAITEAALHQILEIAERKNEDIEAVAAKLGRPLENTRRVEVRDGVSIIPVVGPIFRYANLLTEVSGATSIGVLARDFNEALENPAVRAIVLDVNSPGGEVSGFNEFSGMVHGARGSKPIVAYVSGEAASGAYWIASAADEIVAEESTLLGSIGVVATIRDTRAKDAKSGVARYEVVSSQSPRKRPDPATEEGRSQIQEIVDALADVFVNTVARNRGVTAEEVLANYGRGGMLLAKQAVAAGMADRLGTFEALISDLAATEQPGIVFGAVSAAQSNAGGNTMPEKAKSAAAEKKTAAATSPPIDEGHEIAADKAASVDVKAIEAAAVTAERGRIFQILNAPEAEGRERLARSLALDTDLTPDEAIKALEAAPKASNNALAEAMAGVDNPSVGADAGEEDEVAKEARSILSFATNQRKEATNR